MKPTISLFSFAAAGLLATSMTLRAEDPVPPTPPGSSTTPPAAATSPNTKPTEKGAAPAARGPGAEAQRGDMLERLKSQLDLTPDQIEKIKPIFEKQREKFKALKEDTSIPNDQKRDKYRDIFVASMEELKPILTPEQVTKLKEAMEKRRAERANKP